MSFLNYLLGRKTNNSALVAKERLTVVLAHERASRDGPDYLPRMQKELVAVIAKYVEVSEDKVSINLGRDGGTSKLEINVELDGKRRRPTPVPS